METVALPESKIDATRRLQRKGRWEEASAYRHEVRRRLRTEGKNKAEASEGAWLAMMEKFAPLPPAEVPADGLDDLLKQSGTHEVDLVTDILWVYEHLVDKAAGPEDAPGAGAWALLDWARQYRVEFFETLLPKALAAKEKRPEDSDEAIVKAERNSLQALAKSLKAFWDECKHSRLNEFGLLDEV
jgi:hypothetical protein